MTRTCAYLPSLDGFRTSTGFAPATTLKPHLASRDNRNAGDSPGLYEVDVFYFSIFFGRCYDFSTPCFFPEIAAGTVCVGGAAR